MSTKIEWVTNPDGTKGETWNPITGCTKVSEGCANCYAERMARRLAGRFGYPEAPHHFDVTIHWDRLEQPCQWRKARRIFICSMGDLFHHDVPSAWMMQVLSVAIAANWHTYLILTKRPDRMADFCAGRWWQALFEGRQCGHIWLGVTAENQKRADERIPSLLSIPAAGHFVSLEPLLGAVDLDEYVPDRCSIHNDVHLPIGRDCAKPASEKYYGPWLDWVIAGSESGPGARPMEEDWVQSIRNQCLDACVPFFYKQKMIGAKRVQLPVLDGKVWKQYPNGITECGFGRE